MNYLISSINALALTSLYLTALITKSHEVCQKRGVQTRNQTPIHVAQISYLIELLLYNCHCRHRHHHHNHVCVCVCEVTTETTRIVNFSSGRTMWQSVV